MYFVIVIKKLFPLKKKRHDDQNSNNGYGEVLPERAWTFKHDFRLWCKEESMWCKREKLKQLIKFVFVKF